MNMTKLAKSPMVHLSAVSLTCKTSPIDSSTRHFSFQTDTDNWWTHVEYDKFSNSTIEQVVYGRTSQSSNARKTSSRIVGGQAYNIKQFPFFASLRYFVSGSEL